MKMRPPRSAVSARICLITSLGCSRDSTNSIAADSRRGNDSIKTLQGRVDAEEVVCVVKLRHGGLCFGLGGVAIADISLGVRERIAERILEADVVVMAEVAEIAGQRPLRIPDCSVGHGSQPSTQVDQHLVGEHLSILRQLGA